ncbi:hypothetical protein J6590_032157 [Homalodisca vitripennis]|nr:hypothetical protein J6590_032157 [Homalodisca vitripennis]
MEVNLCSDSQGSLLSSRLEELSNGRKKCFGLVRANTTLTQVIDSASLSDDSPVILLGGSNDSLNGILKIVSTLLKKILSRSELEVNSPSEPSDVIGSGKEIKVLDADMWQVIEDLKNNDSIAFAHSISGDFDHPRRMTAGVAVTFAKQFGKPQRTDCITEFLAYQRSDPQAAAVYSLITKDHYYGKPKKKDYDRAFLDLTLEFKKRKFSTLVCSPIGCVRDHVQLDHFAKKINLFHRTTGAAVLVITKEQPGAQRPLHLGLSYSAFISKLRDEIRRGGLVNQPDTVALTSLTSQPHSPHQVNVQRSSQSFLDNLNTLPPLN